MMKKKPLMIIGASGHGRVAADIAAAMGYETICFLDDADVLGMNVVGKVDAFVKYVETSEFLVAIGNNAIRKKISNQLMDAGAQLVNLIHPSATVSDSVEFGVGNVVMAGAVINNSAKFGNGVIVNTGSSVDHDCDIKDFVHISVGAHLAGTVTVGECTMIGAGATVINNMTICDNCMVGAGAVVVKDIEEQGTYVGVPARKI